MKSKFELYSGKNEHIKELISKEPSWIIRVGNTVLLLIISSLIFLSYYFKYPEVITAKIIITTPIPPIRIKCKVDGIVEKIFLNDQDTVKIDQPIALIKNDQGTKYSEILELKKLLSPVHFERGVATKSLTIDNTEFKNLGSVQSFLSNFINSVIAYNSFINDVPLEKAIKKNRQLIKQYENLVDQNKSKFQLSKKQLDVSKVDFERQKKLFDQSVISPRDFEAQSALLYESEKKLSDIITERQMYQLKILELEKEIQQQVIDEINLSNDNYLKMSSSYNELTAAINAFEDKYVIKSSIDGLVSFLKHNLNNQFVGTGEYIIAVVPLYQQKPIGQVLLPIKGSGKVKINQRVRIFLDNFPYQEYGIINGNIESISLLPSNDTYLINVSLPYGLKTKITDIDFKQELAGQAEIVTEDISLLQRFFIKVRNLNRSI